MILGVVIILLVRSLGTFPIVENIVLVISVSSPTISATILAGLNGGFQQIKKLYSGFLKWRAHPLYYLVGIALLVYPLFIAIIYILLGGTVVFPEFTAFTFFLAIIEKLVMGPLSEEAGWRGYVLPRLESKFSALISSVILGIIWACWHIPLYWIQPRMAFYIYLPIVIVLAILFTWAYNNTNGSLLVTVVYHFCFNFAGGLGLFDGMIFQIFGSIGLGIILILVIVFYKPKRLSRKPDSELPFDIAIKAAEI